MRTGNQLIKATIFKATLLLLVLNATVASAQCKAEVKADQDRNVRSTPAAGTYYAMVITNTGKSADTFSLSASNANDASSNTDGSSTSKNVVVKIEILDKNLKPISEVRVNPGETVRFFAHVVVPKGTATDRWSNTQVVAKSKTCSNYKVDTILHTLVIDSNQDR